MQKIVPSMWFDKSCEEALNYYIETFNTSPAKKMDSKIISIERYPEEQVEGMPMDGMQGKVLTAIFELEGQRFMALDGGPYFQPNGAISFYVECGTQEEVDHFWNRLKEGGDPKAQQCGWLQDKYGFSWQIVPKRLGELLSDPDQKKAKQAMEAMLKMKKIDIVELEQAAEA